jgi:hypothetical protein
MTPIRLAKIKRTLLQMSRSPTGIKAAALASLALELGRERGSRGKEPTYIRTEPPRLPPLSIPGHAVDVRIGTAKSIIKTLLKDVAVWEAFLQGGDDESD